MKRVHPLWRGLLLALALVAALAFTPRLTALAPYLLRRQALVAAAMMLAGAFVASVPERLRHRGQNKAAPLSWKRALASLGGGVLLGVAMALTGGGRLLFSLLEGSVGAYAGVLIFWLCAGVTVRLMGRGRQS